MEKVYTVSQVNSYINAMFNREDLLNHIYLKGEISNCKYHSSGHIYFTLKDSGSQIACIMFAGNAVHLKIRLSEGLGVITKGGIRVYERDGKYQLYVDEVRPDGIGALYEMFDRLKKKLEAEGLFSAEHKRKIPFYCKRIGIVTAKTGAAIQDIISIAKRRNPYVQLILYPAQVQGVGAAESVIRGVRYLQKEAVDVIIIGRGGGSLEDLWAFNEEALAREIYHSEVPVISAVGHETDVTIADFVADLRAPTPSAAAELSVCEIQVFISGLIDCHSDIYHAMLRKVSIERQRTEQLRMKLRINSPRGKLEQKRNQLIKAEETIPRLMTAAIERQKYRLMLLSEAMKGLSPLNKLQSGFSFVSDHNGKVVTSVEMVRTGDSISVAVTDGILTARIEKIEKMKREE